MPTRTRTRRFAKTTARAACGGPPAWGVPAGTGIERVFVCGLARDYCVAWTALDAMSEGLSALCWMI